MPVMLMSFSLRESHGVPVFMMIVAVLSMGCTCSCSLTCFHYDSLTFSRQSDDQTQPFRFFSTSFFAHLITAFFTSSLKKSDGKYFVSFRIFSQFPSPFSQIELRRFSSSFLFQSWIGLTSLIWTFLSTKTSMALIVLSALSNFSGNFLSLMTFLNSRVPEVHFYPTFHAVHVVCICLRISDIFSTLRKPYIAIFLFVSFFSHRIILRKCILRDIWVFETMNPYPPKQDK